MPRGLTAGRENTPGQLSYADDLPVSQSPSTRNKHTACAAPLHFPGFTGDPRKQSTNHSRLRNTTPAHTRRAAPCPAVSIQGALILARKGNVWGRKGNGEKRAEGQKTAAKEIPIRMQKQPEIGHHQRFTVHTHLPLCSQCTRSLLLSIHIQ